MDDGKGNKAERVLGIYTKLMNGYVVNKAEEAKLYEVNERSIQRDIDDIRNFLDLDASRTGIINSIIYDRVEKGYRMEQVHNQKLTNGEVLALCKILLDSRAFMKQDMVQMLDKLIAGCVPETNKRLIRDLVSNETFHYIEPKHKTRFVDTIWSLGQAIRENRYVEIDYLRMKDKQVVSRKVKPVAIMFSEYYFYMAAFIEDEDICKDFDVLNDSFPTIYRVDRIKKLKVSEERFHIPYRDRFEEGEFRKRIQFMYGGRLQKVKFKYSGSDIDAVLDRLLTAEVLDEEDGVYLVQAEVFGKGIDMWLRSQGDMVQLVEA